MTKLREVPKRRGYQAMNESLSWLRIKLKYGKNASYDDSTESEMDNPQPSL
jgi:hypothetical protein